MNVEDAGQSYASEHQPFTLPREEELDLLDTNPLAMGSYTYDFVMDGFEAGGGGMRIHNAELQLKILEKLGFAVEECHKRGMEIHAWIATIPVGAKNSLGCRTLMKKGFRIRNFSTGSYLDLTAGYGGHAREFLTRTDNYLGAVLVDRDDNAINTLGALFCASLTCAPLIALLICHPTLPCM